VRGTISSSSNLGDRDDTITDFNISGTSADILDFTSFGYADTATALAHASQVGADTVFDFGNGDTLTLTGIEKTDLTNSDFLLS
jgi:hypothetical protein